MGDGRGRGKDDDRGYIAGGIAFHRPAQIGVVGFDVGFSFQRQVTGPTPETFIGVNLAVSLNATTDDVRDKIMPINKRWNIKVIADCAARGETIFDEWLVRDYGGMVRQMGGNPADYASALIEREGGPESAAKPFTPAMDIDGGYHGTGNDNAWGQRYADSLTRIMNHDFAHIKQDYDRAMIGDYAGGQTLLSSADCTQFWVGLRSAFPSATFKIHHQIGLDGGMMPPRAALRWSLDGVHDGWGSFGAPTGAPVHVMGISHAEFGPFGPDGVALRREYALYDEVAIWKQIQLYKG